MRIIIIGDFHGYDKVFHTILDGTQLEQDEMLNLVRNTHSPKR